MRSRVARDQHDGLPLRALLSVDIKQCPFDAGRKHEKYAFTVWNQSEMLMKMVGANGLPIYCTASQRYLCSF